MHYLLLSTLISICVSLQPLITNQFLFDKGDIKTNSIEDLHQIQEQEESLFDFLLRQPDLVINMSDDVKTITKNFEKDTITDGSIEFVTGSKKIVMTATYDLGGKTRRKICNMPPVKINMKKKELEEHNFIKKCDKIKIVFQCNTSKSMAASIREEKFIYDLHNLVTKYGHRAHLAQIRTGENDRLFDGLILEDDDDIEVRTDTEILKNKTISTEVIDREEYLKMCLFQYMISNADWSARRGHNTDLFKRNADNSLVIVPYDFDYAGIINNSYAVPPANLPISSVTQRYFMDKSVQMEELDRGIEFFIGIENKVYDLCDNNNYLSDSSKKSMKKFIEGFYDIIKNEKKVKRMMR